MFIKTNKSLRIVTSVISIVAVSFHSALAHADPVDAFIAKEMKTRHIPGLQIAVVKEQKLIKTQSYGSLDNGHQKPVTNGSVFPINSMTKAFTGVLIVRLASAGKLSMSDPIGVHLHDIPETWQAITIEQLLSHTSGLPSILSGNLTELVGDGTEEDAWKTVGKLAMQSTPQSRFSYNQTGYALLGKIIEKYSGKSYADTVKALLTETGMPDTAKWSFRLDGNVAIAQQYVYSDAGHQPLTLNFPPILWPAAGMVSSAGELAKFVIALQEEQYFNAVHLKTLWAPHVLNNGKTAGFNDRENGYAAGWQVTTRELHPSVSASGGNAVTLIVYPSERLSIIVLTNLLGSLPIEFVDHIASYYR